MFCSLEVGDVHSPFKCFEASELICSRFSEEIGDRDTESGEGHVPSPGGFLFLSREAARAHVPELHARPPVQAPMALPKLLQTAHNSWSLNTLKIKRPSKNIVKGKA